MRRPARPLYERLDLHWEGPHIHFIRNVGVSVRRMSYTPCMRQKRWSLCSSLRTGAPRAAGRPLG